LARVPLWTDDFSSLFPILWRRPAREAVVSTAERELQSALQQAERGDTAAAIEHYHTALDNEPDLAMALNNLAWILATNPDAHLRNGEDAVKKAERACELTNFRTTILVGTLAAAYAEAGQFGKAIATAEKACALASAAKDSVLLARNRQLLELYRSGQPVRE
jgi:tetratricopeptide (TPR) repeat protein